MTSLSHRPRQPASTSPIIYQNPQRDIILLDIPRSIAAAQGRTDTLLSTAPLQIPIQLKDDYRPKNQKVKANGSQNTINALHAEYKAMVQHALAHIHTHIPGSWCAPRELLTHVPSCGKDKMDTEDPEKDLESRLREWATWDDSKGGDIAFDLQQMMASLGATSESDSTATHPVSPPKWQMSYRPARETPKGAQPTTSDVVAEVTGPWTPAFHNPGTQPLELSITPNDDTSHGNNSHHETKAYRFTVPSCSTFFLSDSTHSDALRASFRQLTDEYNLPRHFDLVLLDPPWPNRSAKRKRAYEQVGGMPFLKKMLLKMDVDSYLEHNALVGIWITNKESLRKHVLGPGGLFETWNVGLVEEWIWIKTTTQGEPMFDIDGEMRKPYEVLLLGRAAPNSWTKMTHQDVVMKRVIAAVPDVHSRKPCLKGLFEDFGLVPDEYSALEVFSRYLVKGWTAWGNEVIKFNWEHYWASV